MGSRPAGGVHRISLIVLLAGAAALLPRYPAVLPAEVAARLALGVGWLALLVLAWLGAGRLVLDMAAVPAAAPAGLVLAAGALALSLAATVLAATGLLRPLLLVLLLVSAAVAGAVGLLRGRRPEPPWRDAAGWPWALLLVPAVVQVAGLTAPPVFYDTLNYHLAFPERWLMAGGWVEFPRHAYSYYPAAVGALDTYALAAVGGWGARAVHLLLGWTAGLLAAALASGARGSSGTGAAAGRCGGVAGTPEAALRSGPGRAAWWSAALFLLTPSVLQTGPLAVADLGVAAWGGAALLVVLGSPEAASPSRRLLLAGLLAGGAVGAKYLAGATVMLPVLAALLWMAGGGVGRRLGAAALLGLGGGLAAGPWLVRNALWTGDPVYPYLAPLFGLPPQGMTVAGELAQNGPSSLGPILGTLLALPLRTLHPLQVGGVIGPLWLLLLVPAALLVRRRSAAPLWLAALTGLLAWGALVQFGRFLLPVLVPLAALCGTAAAALVTPRRPGDPVGPLAALLLGMVLLWNATAVLDPLAVERLAVAAGGESDAWFQAHWISYWPAVAVVRRELPPDATVLLVGESRCYGVPVRVVVEDPYHPPLLVELARVAPDADALLRSLRRLGITHVLINRAEMARIARMRGLEDFFAEASPPQRARIARLLADLPLLWHDPVLELRAVPPAGAPPPGPHGKGPALRYHAPVGDGSSRLHAGTLSPCRSLARPGDHGVPPGPRPRLAPGVRSRGGRRPRRGAGHRRGDPDAGGPLRGMPAGAGNQRPRSPGRLDQGLCAGGRAGAGRRAAGHGGIGARIRPLRPPQAVSRTPRRPPTPEPHPPTHPRSHPVA